MRSLCLLLLATSTLACGGSSPTAPSADLWATGTWTGTLHTDAGAEGRMTLVITHATSGALTGTATMTLAGLAVAGGAVTGGLPPGAVPPIASGLAITVGGACPVTFAAPSTFSSRTMLEGAIAGGNPACGLDLSARFTVRK